MKFVEIRRTIAAPPERIWRHLTDAKALAAGGLGVIKIEGDIAHGAKLKVWSEASPERAFAVKVSEFVPNRRMVWSGGMPLGLFKGAREYNLTPTPNGTEFHMREEFSGPMLPLIWKSMLDLNPSFEKFANGLRALSEGKA